MNHLLRILVLVITIAQADFLCGQTFSVMRKYDVKKPDCLIIRYAPSCRIQPDIYGWERKMV